MMQKENYEANLADQLRLEEEMLDIGSQRYHADLEKKQDKDRTSETTYAQRLVKETIKDVIAGLDAIHNRSIYKIKTGGNINDRAALIGLRSLFDMVTANLSLVTCARSIGSRIADDLHFATFEQEHKDYYERVIEKFKTDNTTSYRHRHRVLQHLSNKSGVEFEAWTPTELTQVGMAVINTILETTELFEKEYYQPRSDIRSRILTIKLSDSASDWITQHIGNMEFMRPERLPFLVPPAEWTNLLEGGYYHATMRKRTPLVKFKNQAHKHLMLTQMDSSTLCEVVNTIQRTPYIINNKTLNTMREVWRLNLGTGMPSTQPVQIPQCPYDAMTWDKDNATVEQTAVFNRWKRDASLAHAAERERRGKCIQFSRAMSIATRYEYVDKFYYTYQADFRGRLYSVTPVLNPQGADFAKGLLRFAEKKPLGTHGGYWLCVHGANVFGNDKCSYDDRVRFIRDELDSAIRAVASDPISHRDVWGNADKPWQFLSFCFEYADWAAAGYSDAFESSLEVALDGTCNGLQHFSAMLRDSSGGAATNLCPTDSPADIYGVVAEVVNTKLSRLSGGGDENASNWLTLGINRKCTKRPVMTLPYGATKTSCREYIEDYLYECGAEANAIWPEAYDKFVASFYLHNVVWEAMEETLVASMEAMSWLQDYTRRVSRTNNALTWVAPKTGFLIHQSIMRQNSQRIKTQLLGQCYLSIASDTDNIDSRKQALAVAPNFVHSHDAAHMYLTILKGKEMGLSSWWLVHDSYGTHAADAHTLQYCIRDSFVGMYTDYNPLDMFEDMNPISGQMPQPEFGTLNLDDVMNADYFFG